MADTTYKTIVIQSALDGVNRQERLAGEASILPGYLLEISSGAVVTHNTDSGLAKPTLVAVESPTADSASLKTIDVPYANGDTVYYTVAAPGDVLYMILAIGESSVAGVTPLVSNADGGLKAAVIGAGTLEGAVVGVALDTITGDGSVHRCRVMIA